MTLNDIPSWSAARLAINYHDCDYSYSFKYMYIHTLTIPYKTKREIPKSFQTLKEWSQYSLALILLSVYYWPYMVSIPIIIEGFSLAHTYLFLVLQGQLSGFWLWKYIHCRVHNTTYMLCSFVLLYLLGNDTIVAERDLLNLLTIISGAATQWKIVGTLLGMLNSVV